MAARSFGPTRGAGVRIEEQEGQKPITPGALGWAAYAGVLERGMTNQLIVCSTKKDLQKKTGGVITDSNLPDVAQSYFNTAEGAGGLLLVRVTDGNERAATLTLYARRVASTVLGSISAKNGGRWAGKEQNYTNAFSISGDLTATTLTTGQAIWTADEWKGGYVRLSAVVNKRYPIIANSAAGLITVASDATMAADLAASGSPTNFRYYLELANDSKELSFEIRDGEDLPDTEFSLRIYVDGELVKTWGNLSIDPLSSRYWVNQINDDTDNEWIVVADTFTGERTADVRPANHYGAISIVAPTLLTRVLHDLTVVTSPTGANPTSTLGTTNDNMLAQTITITMTSPTAFTAVSDRFGALGTSGSGTVGVSYSPNNDYTPPFTITNGATVLATGNVLSLRYKPFRAGRLVGGYVYPDKVNFKRVKYRIVANAHNTVTVADGSDMTVQAAAADQFLVEAPIALRNGRDGISAITDANYTQQAWDIDNSPFNQIAGKGLGLVKMGTPGVTATAVQQAGRNYAAVKNHQYRYEIPASTIDEATADTYVTDTLGRSDYAVVALPSFADVVDPAKPSTGRLKRISATGMIHGREARIANNFDGYHKAEAGVEATLPAVQALPTGNKILNEELLNPRGIAVLKKAKGNYIIWGDRTVQTDPTWTFKHHREMMSYYEQVLRENFDWIIFQLNSPGTRALAKSALVTYFIGEYRKGALDNDLKFDTAAQIKIDRENNTAITKAAGDMYVDIFLALVDTVERFKIRIGKLGVFELTA